MVQAEVEQGPAEVGLGPGELVGTLGGGLGYENCSRLVGLSRLARAGNENKNHGPGI